MTMPELLTLSLGLSIVVAGVAYLCVRGLERGGMDPGLRELAWASALYVPLLPVLMVGVLLAFPGPVIEAGASSQTVTGIAFDLVDLDPQPARRVNGEVVVAAILFLAAFAGLARGIGLASRTVRLHRLIAGSAAATPDLLAMVEDAAGRAGAPMPVVRMSGSVREALVAGLLRPVLIVPETLASDPASPTTRSVCAHELAHLKRGDHRALWIEEVLLTALAINPLLRVIRDRRAATREEACDAQVLAHADGDTRRLYARSLLDALRVPAGRDVPALTFTSSRRIFVMHRLKAILSPVPVASTRSRLAVLGLGVALTVVAGTSSVAVAARREPVVMPRPSVASSPVSVADPVANPVPAAASTPVVASVPAAEPAPVPAREPIVAPQTQVTTNPSWSQRPTPLRFPAAALEQELTSGSAELSCSVESDGRVSDCTILTEEPLGAGFGGAALEAAARARVSPQSLPGIAAGGLRFVVRFTREVE